MLILRASSYLNSLGIYPLSSATVLSFQLYLIAFLIHQLSNALVMRLTPLLTALLLVAPAFGAPISTSL